MKLLILGDTHGCWGDLNIVIARALRKHPDITALIQVGDFGYAWPGTKPFKFLATFMEDEIMEKAKSLPFYWLDGNHENFDVLEKDQGAWQPGIKYMPRGSTESFTTSILSPEEWPPHGCVSGKNAMFFGGAASHDKAQRIEGISWWQQEHITHRQVYDAMSYKRHINVFFSHEHPLSFPYSDRRYGKDDICGIAEKQALDALLDQFKPEWWFFGHHHAFSQGENNGVKWACAPIIESRHALLWDGDDIIHSDFK